MQVSQRERKMFVCVCLGVRERERGLYESVCVTVELDERMRKREKDVCV